MCIRDRCIPLVKLNGTFLALKGASGDEEYENAKHAIETLGCKLAQRDEKALSDGSKRINFGFVKVKKTPKAYPRAFAKIKKNPL